MKLYELSFEYQRVLDLAGEAGPEAEAAFADTLAGIKGQIDEKIDRCACVIKTMEHEETALRAEEVRMAERRTRIGNAREKLKAYVQREMESVKLDKCCGPRFYVLVQKNPPRLEVEDEEAIPRTYFKPGDPKLDKAKVKDDIEAGLAVPGAKVVQEASLRIK